MPKIKKSKDKEKDMKKKMKKSKPEKEVKVSKKAKTEKAEKKMKKSKDDAAKLNTPKLSSKLQVTVVAKGIRTLAGKVVSSEDGCLTIEHEVDGNTIHTTVSASQVLMKDSTGVQISGDYVIKQFFADSIKASGDNLICETANGKVVVNASLATVSAEKLVSESDEGPTKKSKKSKDEDDFDLDPEDDEDDDEDDEDDN